MEEVFFFFLSDKSKSEPLCLWMVYVRRNMQYPEDTIEVFFTRIKETGFTDEMGNRKKKEEYLWEKKLMSGVQINPQDKVDV